MADALPAGETLPEYDDGPADGVDIAKMRAWLVEHRSWGGSPSMNDPLIREVLAALQAVGDATLIKNGTYRLLRKDAADIERLAARLARGHIEMLVEHGHPVDAANAVIADYEQLEKYVKDRARKGDPNL